MPAWITDPHLYGDYWTAVIFTVQFASVCVGAYTIPRSQEAPASPAYLIAIVAALLTLPALVFVAR